MLKAKGRDVEFADAVVDLENLAMLWNRALSRCARHCGAIFGATAAHVGKCHLADQTTNNYASSVILLAACRRLVVGGHGATFVQRSATLVLGAKRPQHAGGNDVVRTSRGHSIHSIAAPDAVGSTAPLPP